MALTTNVDAGAIEFLSRAIDQAQSDGATALVLEVDTFGGDIGSMQAIREEELGSKVPIIVYVSPSGAHADSAGALVSLAAPIVAMAPGTRIGAASPVDITGQNLASTEQAKVTNALLAQVQSDQTMFHRNVPLAEDMVTKASAYDAQDAVNDGIVNLQASSLADLLAQVNGEPVTLAGGATVTLSVSPLPVRAITLSPGDQIFQVLLDPNVLFVLFIVALVCIFLELSHPGAIVPGTVGALALVLFFFGAGSISPNWTGLSLMLLSLVLLVVDVRAHTHGVLTLGALISLIVGSLLFFNSNPLEPHLNLYLLGGAAAGVGVVALIVLRYAIAAQRAKVDTGGDKLIGLTAVVIDPLDPDGRVWVLGEDWKATLEVPAAGRVATGAQVRIIGVAGLRLRVRPEP